MFYTSTNKYLRSPSRAVVLYLLISHRPQLLQLDHQFPPVSSKEMETEGELLHDLTPLFRQYKSGRMERLAGTATADPAPLDPTTGVATKRAVIDPTIPISACLYLPPNSSSTTNNLAILIYFHGGAFCIESAFSPTYHPHLTALSARARLLIVSVDYRLAPEHPLPAAYHDCWSALQWAVSRVDPWLALHADARRVFLGGDSAGANIAHRMAVWAGGGVRIEGVALVHPYFWGSEAVGEEGREEGWRRWMDALWRAVSGGGRGMDDAWINPMAEAREAVEAMGCRRVAVFVAENDPMRERGRAYYEMLRGSEWGGEVEMVETEGVGHVFHLEKPPGDAKAEELTGHLVRFFTKDRN